MSCVIIAETVQELDGNLKLVVDAMRSTDYPVTAVASGCELFLRFITLATLDNKVQSFFIANIPVVPKSLQSTDPPKKLKNSRTPSDL